MIDSINKDDVLAVINNRVLSDIQQFAKSLMELHNAVMNDDSEKAKSIYIITSKCLPLAKQLQEIKKPLIEYDKIIKIHSQLLLEAQSLESLLYS